MVYKKGDKVLITGNKRSYGRYHHLVPNTVATFIRKTREDKNDTAYELYGINEDNRMVYQTVYQKDFAPLEGGNNKNYSSMLEGDY